MKISIYWNDYFQDSAFCVKHKVWRVPCEEISVYLFVNINDDNIYTNFKHSILKQNDQIILPILTEVSMVKTWQERDDENTFIYQEEN